MKLRKIKIDVDDVELGEDEISRWSLIKQRMVERKKSLSKIVRNESLRNHLQDYCSSTSIHGIKYLGEPGRPFGERICWIIIFVICFTLNGYLIRQVWNKWHDSPVIVSFDETATPVWNVPFPAITICSEIKSRKEVFDFDKNIALRKDRVDNTTKWKLSTVSLLCDDHVNISGDQYANTSAIEFLLEVTPPFNETISKCHWRDKEENCSSLFSQVMTQDGFCYTFNMLNKADLFRGNPFPNLEEHGKKRESWSLDGGYDENASLYAYPYRAFSAGVKAGISLQMKSRSINNEYYCRGPVQGFKVLLHNPAEFPSVSDRYFRTPFNQEVVIAVQPNIMTTSKGLRSYKPHDRQCYFPSDRYLEYFQVYTQRNCELECITNFTLAECGCVYLHMPKRGKTEICGPEKKLCTIKAAEDLRLKEIDLSTSSSSCDCLPACTSIQYNFENTQANFDPVTVSWLDKDINSTNEYKFSRISIFFKDMQFTTSRRSELFGIVDFMANCGGLLGLCCGMSFLSILELIYYITLRIWGNIEAINKKKEKEKDNEARTQTVNEQTDIEFIDYKNI